MTLQNFSWILPGKLAGSDIPGQHSADNLSQDLRFLSENGIGTLVSLERPAGKIKEISSELSMEWIYFPVPDFSFPSDIQGFKKLVSSIITTFESGVAVCVHCHAGIGRTGMVLSCVIGTYFLLGAQKAIAMVRRYRPAIDTYEQENFVSRFLEEYEH